MQQLSESSIDIDSEKILDHLGEQSMDESANNFRNKYLNEINMPRAGGLQNESELSSEEEKEADTSTNNMFREVIFEKSNESFDEDVSKESNESFDYVALNKMVPPINNAY